MYIQSYQVFGVGPACRIVYNIYSSIHDNNYCKLSPIHMMYIVLHTLIQVYIVQSTDVIHELLNLPPLVLKDRHLSGSAFCSD